MKEITRYLLLAFFITINGVYAEPLSIKLTSDDQRRLANSFSKIDSRYRTEERIDSSPYIWTVRKHYQFLDETHGLSIKCSQDYMMVSAIPTNNVCDVVFNDELSLNGALEVHDGFMPVFIIAEIKDADMARILYTAISDGMNRKEVFYSSQEMIAFNHPTTGQVFPASRLRIDCKRDDHFKDYSCIASAVK